MSQAKRSGAAVADEPLAARAGAAALASGGSAVDAVATMFFTLTATYPVAAGLGGGGICLVRDASGQVTEFDFLTRAPSRQGAYAVPGAVRGFADMQKQYGALPWQRVVAPGEAFAATGFPVSQALFARLAAAQNVVRLDAGLAAEFLDESGQPRAVASEVRNVPLSQTLGQIRMAGADGFHKGTVAGRHRILVARPGRRGDDGRTGGGQDPERRGAHPRDWRIFRRHAGRAHRRGGVQRLADGQSFAPARRGVAGAVAQSLASFGDRHLAAGHGLDRFRGGGRQWRSGILRGDDERPVRRRPHRRAIPACCWPPTRPAVTAWPPPSWRR